MILTVHCSHDFNKMDAGAIEIFAANTVTDMGTFPLIFVTPKIPLATITTQVAAVHTANLNFGLNPLTKPLLDAAMKTLRTSLRQQADYVDGIANGDATIIEKSGFHATQSESNPAVIPAARQNFDAEAIPTPLIDKSFSVALLRSPLSKRANASEVISSALVFSSLIGAPAATASPSADGCETVA